MNKEEIKKLYNSKLSKDYPTYYDLLEYTAYIKKQNKQLKQENKKYKEVIDKAIEYIKHYETIRGYYEYEECGYDEYNYEEDLKEELLDILKEVE